MPPLHIAILAGGKGKRLWPLSSQAFPKPCLSLGKNRSLLQQTVTRFSKINYASLVISTQKRHHAIIKHQLREFKRQPELLIEPMSRNTAPAIAWTLKFLLDKKKVALNELCLVTPSDLFFSSHRLFTSLITVAKKEALKKKIVTFGITPDAPETGYGYIQVEPKPEKKALFVKRFIEKPTKIKARKLLKEGSCFWNSGVFVFEIATFLAELKRHAPALFSWMHEPFASCWDSFKKLPSEPIDKALMEKSSSLVLIPYPAKWVDQGSWEHIYRNALKDDCGNVTRGNVIAKETTNSLLYSTTSKLVTLGVQDLVVIQTKETTLIAKRTHLSKLENILNISDVPLSPEGDDLLE